MFLFVGADPNSDWLRECEVGLDDKGFVLTGPDAGRDQHGRGLETSVDGVFAVGDLRSGSTKRVAAAAGEGAAVVAQIHGFLAAARRRPAKAGTQVKLSAVETPTNLGPRLREDDGDSNLPTPPPAPASAPQVASSASENPRVMRSFSPASATRAAAAACSPAAVMRSRVSLASCSSATRSTRPAACMRLDRLVTAAGATVSSAAISPMVALPRAARMNSTPAWAELMPSQSPGRVFDPALQDALGAVQQEDEARLLHACALRVPAACGVAKRVRQQPVADLRPQHGFAQRLRKKPMWPMAGTPASRQARSACVRRGR
jgi:hypothetical protein